MTDTKAIDFEKALNQLESTVAEMEKGELTLEQSLQAFEKGVNLVNQCQTVLSETERKIEILTAEGLQPLQPQSFDAKDTPE
ncbi:MAG: exodeoxyribonuclease VII small subunit [Pseudomonadota bacterium]